MKQYIKLLLIYILRFLNHLFYIFPVRSHRIYFTSYRGDGMCCNPYYVYKYMEEHCLQDYEFIWEIREGGIRREGQYIAVRPNTIRAAYYRMTAGILFSNIGFNSSIPKRKGQIYINTWHGGGAYKQVGVDLKEEQHPANIKINKLCAAEVDYFISSSREFTRCMSAAKLIPQDKFLGVGMPRNDILLKEDTTNKKTIAGTIRRSYGLPEEQKIVLYAPTYRDNTRGETEKLDVRQTLNALTQRFGGEWTMLVRAHHFSDMQKMENAIDVSDYPDMQELLVAADVLITDYSSSMWDFALTGKPGFLFVPDLCDYESERKFYTPIETWPFAYGTDNESLCKLIRDYSREQGLQKSKQHLQNMGNQDSGQASKRILEMIRNEKKK